MLMNVKVSTLPNGIRVATSEVPRVESVTVGIWAAVGSRYETDQALSGISHFIEHMLFKGTASRSARDISMEIEGRGGYLNAFTQEESTCYYAHVSFDRLEGAFDVLADMYLNPEFDRVELDKERGVIIEEIKMYRDQPQHLVHELLDAAVWKNHPLGRAISGTTESVSGMTRRTLLDFKNASYVPAGTLVAFAGRLEHSACVDLVKSHLGSLSRSRRPSARPASAARGQDPMALLKKDIEQTQLAMAGRIFGKHDDRRYALRILNAVLGENMSSRLFQVVREQHGLAYSVHSSYHLYADAGTFGITAGLDRTRHLKAIELMVREMNRLKTTPVPPRTVRQAKDYVVGQLRLGLEGMTHQMMWISDNLLSHGRIVPPEEVIAKINAVTAGEVQALARQLFKPSHFTVAMISPEINDTSSRTLKSLLSKM